MANKKYRQFTKNTIAIPAGIPYNIIIPLNERGKHYERETVMCYNTDAQFDGNKVLERQVGDLATGDKYRTPDGRTMLMLGGPNITDKDGYSLAADTQTGLVEFVSNSINLGRDREGRLYASRSLNPAPTAIVAAS